MKRSAVDSKHDRTSSRDSGKTGSSSQDRDGQNSDSEDGQLPVRPTGEQGPFPRRRAPTLLALNPAETLGAFGSAAEEEVKARAERFAANAPTQPSLQLDDIWSGDVESIDLPEYVKVHSTTMSFPEKVSETRMFV